MSQDPHEEFVFVPLGGAGEFGMNLSLYGFEGKWLMVDLGITFGDASTPGIDILMPDPAFIEERRDDLLAIVLTHAHEDHLGAVPYLWERLRCPVYATPFAAAILRRKLHEAGLENVVPVTVVRHGESVRLGPFDVTYIGVTHSIPEGSSLLIRTSAGNVIHTGDWKLDPTPLLGKTTDEKRFAAAGDKGVLALICDSTNIFNPGDSGSEAAVRESLMEIVKDRPGRVAITTFASNAARIATVAAVAQARGRELAVVGRSLWRIIEAAKECGYLGELPRLLTDEDAAFIPRDRLLLLCTGSQGEPRGAMNRIASHDHPYVSLEAGDTVIFSSKIIPGNERQIGAMCNLLVQDGIEVLTEKDHFVHVSGHPARGEMKRLYGWVRPRIAVPVHGEVRHLTEHAAFAREQGVAETVVVQNGAVLRLAPGPAAVLDHVPVGRLALDGATLIPLDSETIRTRKRLMHNGAVMITLVLDHDGNALADPRVIVLGVSGGDGDGLAETLERALRRTLADMPRPRLRDSKEVELAARRAVNRHVRNVSGKRPVVKVQIVRVDAVAGAEELPKGRAVAT
ncbi:MAG: ribonuclease J [Proteobacteria bacterium]|nr:ribonuclease J [Pseudomonadota bacterium]